MPRSHLRVAVLFHRFGPYHLSRLHAAADRMDVHGIELSSTDRVYAWDGTAGQERVPRTVVAPDLERLPGRTVARRVAAVLDGVAPDVVAVPGWSDRGALAALLWCVRTGTPAVMMSDSTANDHPRRAAQEAVKRSILGLCGAALVSGTRARDYAVRLGMPRTQVRLGFDTVDNVHFSHGAALAHRDAAEARASHGLPERYILTVCRFVEDKNLVTLITAYAGYRAEGGTWPLVLAGDGPQRPMVTQMLQDQNLVAHVHLPGFLQYDTLPACYGLAGVFVLPSIVEPWGLVVNEAMAAGLPILVSDRCGCVDDLVDGNGVRFNPHDITGLTQHLHAMTHPDTPWEAMGRRSREIVAAWGAERFVDGLLDAAEAALAHPVRVGLLRRAMLRGLIARPRHRPDSAGAAAKGDAIPRSSTNSAWSAAAPGAGPPMTSITPRPM